MNNFAKDNFVHLKRIFSAKYSLIKFKWILSIYILLSMGIQSQDLNDMSNQLEGEDQATLQIHVKPLNDIQITSSTGEKPQSKVWFYADYWWTVLPNETGTKLWRLDEEKWTNVLHLSESTKTSADIRNIDNFTHILLYQDVNSELISIEYNREFKKYDLWSKRQFSVSIPLEYASETATIDIDTSGRMWLASDDKTEVHVRWSDPPYTFWSKPITLETNILPDDICTICAFPNGSMGVMWSNQKKKSFGFRIHQNGSRPDIWLTDEIPASESAIPLNGGMADDHLNIAVSSDGTLYAAVKTSYDSVGYPLVALLIRQITGKWDELKIVDDEGSRGIVLLNENEDRVIVCYTSYRDNKIVYKISRTNSISFGKRQSLIEGWKNINNVTSTKQNIASEVVILASESGIARGVKLLWPSKE